MKNWKISLFITLHNAQHFQDFMMILTSHQFSVGSVLEFGGQLINEGFVNGKEEEIQKQMAVLSEKLENLMVSARRRQKE